MHRLCQPLELLGLTPDLYRELVAGKPNPSEYKRWFKELVPSNWAPSAWTKALQPFADRAKLKESIISVGFGKPLMERGVDWNAIRAHLEANGHRITGERHVHDTVIQKLDSCPTCGLKGGSPWLGSTGRLHCFRTSCEANVKGGIPPWNWIEVYEVPLVEFETATVENNASIEEGREAIRQAINGDNDAVINVTAGVGKTTTALIEIIPTCKEQRVLFTVPTLRLAEEVYQEASKRAEGEVPVTLIRGRNDATDTAPATCHRMDVVNERAKQGYLPGLAVCPRCVRRKDGSCDYFNQFRGLPAKGLVITTHAAAMWFSGNKFKCDLWVMDENPRDAILQGFQVGQGAITAVGAKLPHSSEQVIIAIENVARAMVREIKNRNNHGRLYAANKPLGAPWVHDLWELGKISEDQKATLRRDLAVFNRLYDANGVAEPLQEWIGRLLDSGLDFNALTWLWTAVGAEPGTAYIRTEMSPRQPIKYVHMIQRPLPKYETATGNIKDMACRFVVLDATADHAELVKLLGRKLDLVTAQVDLPECHAVWLQKGLGKLKTSKRSNTQLKRYLEDGLPYLRPGDQKVLLATHQGIEGRILTLARELRPDLEFMSTHFWASRGVNAFKECDAVLCIGTPTASPTNTLDAAMALFPDPDERERWQVSLGEADLVQTVNRIRPVYGGKIIIVVGNVWPQALGIPTIYLDQRRQNSGDVLQEAMKRTSKIVQTHGVITKELAWSFGIGLAREEDQVRTHHRALFGGGVPSELASTLIRDTLLDLGQVGTPPPIILLRGKNDWNHLISLLKVEFPQLDELNVKLKSCRNAKTKAFGSIQAARDLYAKLGAEFDEERWSGLEKPLVLKAQREAEQEKVLLPAWMIGIMNFYKRGSHASLIGYQ